MATNEFWSQEDLLLAVQESHKVLSNTTFFHVLDWTVAKLHPDTVQASVSFVVEDPDGTIAQTLNKAWVMMFSSQVLPQAWKEKINLHQCTQCWRLDSPQHPSCARKCCKCRSGSHLEDQHNLACDSCKNTGRLLTELQQLTWICTHL